MLGATANLNPTVRSSNLRFLYGLDGPCASEAIDEKEMS